MNYFTDRRERYDRKQFNEGSVVLDGLMEN